MVVLRGSDTVKIRAIVSSEGKLGVGPKKPTEDIIKKK